MKQQCKTLPTPRSNKSSGSFIANTLDKDFQYIQDNPIQSDQKQRQTRPYMMIQPKLIEEFDANNQKTLKVSFKNSITDLQTLEEPIVKQRENSGSVQGRPKQCKSNIPPRKSARQLTQL